MNESIGLIAAFCTTIAFLPQAVKTIRTKNTTGISLLMYVIFSSGIVLWFIYGLLISNRPIIFSNGITSIFAFTVLFYKMRESIMERKSGQYPKSK